MENNLHIELNTMSQCQHNIKLTHNYSQKSIICKKSLFFFINKIQNV